MAIGSSGVRPGPSVGRIETWPPLNGVSHDVSAKRSAFQRNSGFPSTLEMHRLMEAELCGGVIESARIRPRDGSSGSKATFDGISQSSAKSR